MLVLPNRLLCRVLSTSDQDFVSFQPILSSTYTDKNRTFFTMYKETFPIWKPFPNRAAIGFSQIAFPIIVLPKDSVQEERLGLQYWTMIQAICVVVDEFKSLDIPIFEFSIILEHLPCSPGYKHTLHQLLVHRNQAIWK